MFTFDASSDAPLYEQLHDQIVRAVATRRLRNGSQLPSVRHLARDLKINPATVKKAYDQLQREGIVYTADRSGTMVTVPEQVRPDVVADVRNELEQACLLAVARGVPRRRVHSLIDVILRDMTRA